MSPRRFYRKVITVTILAEDPIGDHDLDTVHYQIKQGDWSGQVTHGETKQINGKQMAKALVRQGSDPGFFRLTKNGEDERD